MPGRVGNDLLLLFIIMFKQEVVAKTDNLKSSKKYYVFVTGIVPNVDINYLENSSGKVVAIKQKEWLVMVFEEKYYCKHFIIYYSGWKTLGRRLKIIRINKRAFDKIIENPNNSKKSLKMTMLDMYLHDKGYCSEITL